MIQAIKNLFKPKQIDWKKPTEIHYSDDSVLTVHTLDGNCTQYRHDPTTLQWRRLPSFKGINNKEDIESLESALMSVLSGKRIRGGWVKSLR